MTSPETVIWLRERTALGILLPESLSAIAQALEEKVFPANHKIATEATAPEALYILLEGKLESESSNKNNPSLTVGFLPGSIIH
ncbi:hypothetical protein CBF18_11270, partial [Mastigocladus laminosus WC112]